jgi:hypothetical protein
MPFVHITWLPKTCRTAAVRKEVADAVIKVRSAACICSFVCVHMLLCVCCARVHLSIHPSLWNGILEPYYQWRSMCAGENNDKERSGDFVACLLACWNRTCSTTHKVAGQLYFGDDFLSNSLIESFYCYCSYSFVTFPLLPGCSSEQQQHESTNI